MDTRFTREDICRSPRFRPFGQPRELRYCPHDDCVEDCTKYTPAALAEHIASCHRREILREYTIKLHRPHRSRRKSPREESTRGAPGELESVRCIVKPPSRLSYELPTQHAKLHTHAYTTIPPAQGHSSHMAPSQRLTLEQRKDLRRRSTMGAWDAGNPANYSLGPHDPGTPPLPPVAEKLPLIQHPPRPPRRLVISTHSSPPQASLRPTEAACYTAVHAQVAREISQLRQQQKEAEAHAVEQFELRQSEERRRHARRRQNSKRNRLLKQQVQYGEAMQRAKFEPILG